MDGINIKEYDYSQYMSVFAPVFQDFRLFSFSAMENLVLTEEAGEKETTAAAGVMRQVGIYDRFASLKNGLDTILFKYFDDDGIEPSAGNSKSLRLPGHCIRMRPLSFLTSRPRRSTRSRSTRSTASLRRWSEGRRPYTFPTDSPAASSATTLRCFPAARWRNTARMTSL